LPFTSRNQLYEGRDPSLAKDLHDSVAKIRGLKSHSQPQTIIVFHPIQPIVPGHPESQNYYSPIGLSTEFARYKQKRPSSFTIGPDMLTRNYVNALITTDVLTAELLFVFLGPERSLPNTFP
jgi:hypothetical protein